MSTQQFFFFMFLGGSVESLLAWSEQLAQVAGGRRDEVSGFARWSLFVTVIAAVSFGSVAFR